MGGLNKLENIAISDNVNELKYFVEIDDYRYPKDAVITKPAENDYSDQHRDFKLFYEDYFEEELLTPFLSNTDMKSKNTIRLIDIGHQVNHKFPRKFQLFGEYQDDPTIINARFFITKIRQRQNGIISDG